MPIKPFDSSKESQLGRPTPPALLAVVPALALALAGLPAWMPHDLPAVSATAKAPAHAQSTHELPPFDLDNLRNDATIGDLEAGRLLIAQLLDRYERAGNTDDLFEAVQWMDRGWGAGYYQQSGLAARIFEHHCTHKVLRWHWLCDVGE
jgi:hypothetical protein